MTSTETTPESERWFGQAALADAATAPDSSYSDEQLMAAEGSVRALIADLRYIMTKEHASRWPVLASAALQHHSPPVPGGQLAADYRALQDQGRVALGGICRGAFNEIREAVVEIRSIESRLQARI